MPRRLVWSCVISCLPTRLLLLQSSPDIIVSSRLPCCQFPYPDPSPIFLRLRTIFPHNMITQVVSFSFLPLVSVHPVYLHGIIKTKEFIACVLYSSSCAHVHPPHRVIQNHPATHLAPSTNQIRSPHPSANPNQGKEIKEKRKSSTQSIL
jgi:hypothetical protein